MPEFTSTGKFANARRSFANSKNDLTSNESMRSGAALARLQECARGRGYHRLSTVQEHFMILRAIKNGVDEARIARSLKSMSATSVRKREVQIGICPEAVQLHREKRAVINQDAHERQLRTSAGSCAASGGGFIKGASAWKPSTDKSTCGSIAGTGPEVERQGRHGDRYRDRHSAVVDMTTLEPWSRRRFTKAGTADDKARRRRPLQRAVVMVLGR
jgi:hypothetical protein